VGRTRSRCATYATARTSSSTVASRASSSGTPIPPALLAAGHAALEIVVESMGRTNYGPLLGERKGILGGVLHHHQYVHGYTARPIPLEDISRLRFQPGTTNEPLSFFRTTLEVAEPGDAFLALPGWGKGYVWINGFLLGRYWKQGPQQTLYVPAPLLETGTNEIIHLELDQVGSLLQIRDRPAHDGS
jgi:beta-galactosidase